MRLLFCHDGPVKIFKEKNFPAKIIEENVSARYSFPRYLEIANEIVIVTRTELVQPYDPKEPTLNENKFRIVSVPDFSSLKGFLFSYKQTKEILSDQVKLCDLVIARLPSRLGNLAVDLAIETKKPYLIELVGCPWDALWHHGFKGKIIAPLMYLATKKRVKKSKFVIYVTERFLQKRYPTEGRSITCSNVVLDKFNGSKIENRLEKINKINFEYKKLVIGTIAAVDVRYKGQHYVINALGKLKKQGYTNFEYQLIGAGDQTYLKSVAAKNDVRKQVKFLGRIRHDEVFDWLDRIDVYIQPSQTEGLPRSLIEAMSRGLLVIGSSAGGIPELLDSSFVTAKSKTMIDEICNLLINIDKKQMEQQAIRNFKKSKEFDFNIINNRRKDFYIEFSECNDYYS